MQWLSLLVLHSISSRPIPGHGNCSRLLPVLSFFTSMLRIYLLSTRLCNVIQRMVSGALFYQLLVGAVVTAINLFSLESHGIFSIYGISAAYDLAVMLSSTSIYCYLSEGLTFNLNKVGDTFYDLPWYQLPCNVQMLIVPAMQYTQREFRLKGAGFVDCSLSVFGRVKSEGAARPTATFALNHTFLCLPFQISRSAGSYYLFIRKLK